MRIQHESRSHEYAPALWLGELKLGELWLGELFFGQHARRFSLPNARWRFGDGLRYARDPRQRFGNDQNVNGLTVTSLDR